MMKAKKTLETFITLLFILKYYNITVLLTSKLLLVEALADPSFSQLTLYED